MADLLLRLDMTVEPGILEMEGLPDPKIETLCLLREDLEPLVATESRYSTATPMKRPL